MAICNDEKINTENAEKTYTVTTKRKLTTESSEDTEKALLW